MPVIGDKFGRASIPTDTAVATTVKTTRAAGVLVLEAFDLSKFATDTPVFFVTYKKTTDPVTGVVSITNLVSWKALVNSGANTLTNLTVQPGYVDGGNAIGDFIECIPTSAWENSLIDGIFVGHNPDGSFKTSAVNTALGITTDDPLRDPTRQADYVVSGGDIVLTTGFTATISNIVYKILGLRYAITSIPNKAFTPSKDTYVDVNNVGTGAIVYTEVANGAASPALAAGHKRIARVITNGSTITRIQQIGYDTLGNRYYNTVAVQPTSSWCSVAGMPALPPTNDTTVISVRLSKPADIMTVRGKQEVIYQPLLRCSAGGVICLYRISYVMRPGASYVSTEPNSGVTAGDSANYQQINWIADATESSYWASYDLLPYPFGSTMRVEQKRDGAAGADVNPGATEMEGCYWYYNRDYSKV